MNFSATETFYSDKRPFFAENNNMFDVSDRMHRIINTRRIGGRPDYDCSAYGDLEELLPTEYQTQAKLISP